jgi:tRNA wybutosine-synthesizing protein 4
MEECDEKTKFTALDSIACKYYASTLGYIKDPCLEVINRRLTKSNVEERRRSPLINRGYFARVEAVNMVMKQFLGATDGIDRQILILGCGFDTLSLLNCYNGHKSLTTFEVDFKDIIEKKISIIRTEPLFQELIEQSQSNGENCKIIENASFLGPLRFVAQDLRNSSQLLSDLINAGFDPSGPTLIVTECVFLYMEKDKVLDICNNLNKLCVNSIWISYDMISPHDSFGKMIIKNLTSRGFHIPSIIDFPTLKSQELKFMETNWSDAKSYTMLSIYNDKISAINRKRIEKIEILDELEEWNLLMSHYSFTIAIHGPMFVALKSIIFF